MQALGEPLSRMKKLCEAVSAHLDVLRAGAIYRQEREVALDSRPQKCFLYLSCP